MEECEALVSRFADMGAQVRASKMDKIGLWINPIATVITDLLSFGDPA